MVTLTISRGVSGSGKSTWARNQNAVVVSRDDIRHGTLNIPADVYYQADKDVLYQREQLVTSIEHAMIKAALRAGKDVISDNTNIQPRFAQKLADLAYALGADVQVKVFDTSLLKCQSNNILRKSQGDRYVQPEVITKQHSQLAGTRDWAPAKPYKVNPYTGTPGKPKAFLYDLDGTTYHMSGKRGPYDHNVDVDDPDPVIQEIVRTLSLDLVPIAMSGRKEVTRDTTLECLKRDGVPFEHLFMRRDDDNRKDSIVKAELFDTFVRDNFDVQFVLDDRNQVVTETWRAMGLKCLQVAEGDF